MIASPHVAAGVLAGVASARMISSRPRAVALAVLLALLSHVALDAIPHGDYAPLRRPTFLWVAAVETVAACAVGALLARRALPPRRWAVVAAGVIASALPDAKFVAPLLLPADAAAAVRRIGDDFHDWFHAGRTTPAAGLAAELACAALLFAALALLGRRPVRA